MGSAFLTVAAALVTLGLHPFTTYPASLAALAWLRPRSLERKTRLGSRVALCVCAYNEERIIGAKAENLLAMRHAVPDLELLVYVDAASDRTAEVLSAFGDQIRVIVGTERHGKTHGMNTLIEATEADYVVFSDANVMFAPDAIPKLLSPFQDPTVGCVCGHLIYTSADGNATASTGSAYWRLEEAIKDLESRTGSTMGADGSIFAIRRELHHAAPPDIIDDMYVSMSILCDGYRVVRASDAIAYEETVSRPQEEFRRKIRIACQAFNVHRHLWPRLKTLSLLDQVQVRITQAAAVADGLPSWAGWGVRDVRTRTHGTVGCPRRTRSPGRRFLRCRVGGDVGALAQGDRGRAGVCRDWRWCAAIAAGRALSGLDATCLGAWRVVKRLHGRC